MPAPGGPGTPVISFPWWSVPVLVALCVPLLIIDNLKQWRHRARQRR